MYLFPDFQSLVTHLDSLFFDWLCYCDWNHLLVLRSHDVQTDFRVQQTCEGQGYLCHPQRPCRNHTNQATHSSCSQQNPANNDESHERDLQINASKSFLQFV